MEMVTAEQIKADLKTMNACEGLDTWIVLNLRRQFLKSVGAPVSVDQGIITRNMKWPSQAFEAAMTQRGFKVEFLCEDRPCSLPYYKISL